MFEIFHCTALRFSNVAQYLRSTSLYRSAMKIVLFPSPFRPTHPFCTVTIEDKNTRTESTCGEIRKCSYAPYAHSFPHTYPRTVTYSLTLTSFLTLMLSRISLILLLSLLHSLIAHFLTPYTRAHKTQSLTTPVTPPPTLILTRTPTLSLICQLCLPHSQ